MNIPIKTNQLHYTINRPLLDSVFDIFCVRTSDKHFKSGAYIIDVPLLNNSVCSVLFRSGNFFYVLMEHSDMNKHLLKQILSDADGAEYITFSQVFSETLPDDVVLQLLLNSMGNYTSSLLRFNNLTGHLYCFHPKWLVHGKKQDADVILKVPCLELKITPECRLQMEVHTFTSELLRNRIEFTKKKFEAYPKYVFSAHNTLRRKLKDDRECAFIMRQTRNEKTEIPFLNLQSIERFQQSKMGVLAAVLENFNTKFDRLANLQFADIDVYTSLEYTRATAKENKQVIAALLQELPIKVVDCIQDQYSEMFCKEICNLIFSKYGIKASLGKRVSKKHLNIRVIHNAAYYMGTTDPHDNTFDGVAVQHITFEDFLESSEFAISTVIHEVLIKNDLEKRRITLFDWNSLGFTEDIVFGVDATDEQEEKYVFMTIHPDGSFEFSEQTLNLFDFNQYSQCVEIFENAKIQSEKVHGIIKNGRGDINIIKDTGWFTIPEIHKIKEELSVGNTKLRGSEKREELLSSCLDIKLFQEDEAQYYFVGIIGNGMRPYINRAANIRKIEVYENSPLLFEQLLPLMNVTFVHNGQLTVVPFPFKYLREYIRLCSKH